MDWSHCGTDDEGREIGYGVAAICDCPGCDAAIYRGLAYVCGTMHGGENGCGKYFCDKHHWPPMHACHCLEDCKQGEHRWDNGQVGKRDCHVCGVAEDEQPCKPGEHQWTGKRAGGPPDMAESAEWVGYCAVCGMEGPKD